MTLFATSQPLPPAATRSTNPLPPTRHVLALPFAPFLLAFPHWPPPSLANTMFGLSPPNTFHSPLSLHSLPPTLVMALYVWYYTLSLFDLRPLVMAFSIYPSWSALTAGTLGMDGRRGMWWCWRDRQTPMDDGDCICSNANFTDTNINQGGRAESEGQMPRLSPETAFRGPAIQKLRNAEERLRLVYGGMCCSEWE